MIKNLSFCSGLKNLLLLQKQFLKIAIKNKSRVLYNYQFFGKSYEITEKYDFKNGETGKSETHFLYILK